MNPKNPVMLACPRHRFPTSSDDSTSAHVPIVALLDPEINLREVYTHILVETVVSNPATDMTKHDKTMVFLRPSEESASVMIINPTVREPR